MPRKSAKKNELPVSPFERMSKEKKLEWITTKWKEHIKGKRTQANLVKLEKFLETLEMFNPSKPNTYLHSLYNIVNPSKKKPLVLVIDEVDILLNTIVKGIPEHKRYDRLVDSKTSWNSFLDDIDIGIYKNLILILCSNKSKEEIDKLDPSFLRKGRVHMYVNMNDIDYIDKNL